MKILNIIQNIIFNKIVILNFVEESQYKLGLLLM